MRLSEMGLFNAKGECNSYYACYCRDWSYDKFVKACKAVKPLPRKGVHPSSKLSNEERFATYLKTSFAEYKAEQERKYDCRFIDLEDMFKAFANEWLFSDFYKDTFNQRPHLGASFYLYAMGYENVGGIRFCMSPFSEEVEDAIWSAEAYRAYLMERC